MSPTNKPDIASMMESKPPIGRILQLTQAPGGGVGRHFVDLCEGLHHRGIDVVGMYSPRKMDSTIGARIERTSVPMHALPMRRGIHPGDLFTFKELVREIRRLGPFDLIHGHSSKGGALARLAARKLKLPVVYSPHALITLDPTLSPLKKRFYGTIERYLSHRTSAIIAVSPDEAEHIREQRLQAPVTHVANGIEIPDFPSRDACRAKHNYVESDVVIGFVGRMTHQKAPDVMLKAFVTAAKQAPNLKLLMIGSGPLDEEMAVLVSKSGVRDRIKMLGDTSAIEEMPAFDIFCLSSRYEGMPYVYLEALAAGLPIVTTDVGGARMCVKPGSNGCIVPPGNAAELAQALMQAYQDGPLRQRWSTASREAARNYTIEKMLDQTIQVYSNIRAQNEKACHPR